MIGLRSKSLAPQQLSVKQNKQSISRKHDPADESDDTMIQPKPIEKENKKPEPGNHCLKIDFFTSMGSSNFREELF